MPTVAMLKIHKAHYGTCVYLNGRIVGEHAGCFTPGYFDLRKQLRGNGTTNELIVRIGACAHGPPGKRPLGPRLREDPLHPGHL